MITKVLSAVLLIGIYVMALCGWLIGSLTILCLGLVVWVMDVTKTWPKKKVIRVKKPKISAKKYSEKAENKIDKALNGQTIHYDMGLDLVKKPRKSKRNPKKTYDCSGQDSILTD
jgi:hypothetical protein